MPRQKNNGAYAPLGYNYFMDDAILKAGDQAELLFVRMLSFCSGSASDGYVTDTQLRLVVGMGLESLQERINSLLSVGLVEEQDGGFAIRSWLRWNRSADQIGKNLKRDRERKVSSTESGRKADGKRTESVRQSNPIQSNKDIDQPSIDRHIENEIFDEFWAAYPRRVGKPKARLAFKAAAKKSGAEIIVAGAKRYADDPNRQELFTAHPTTWLHRDGWDDPPLPNRNGEQDEPQTPKRRLGGRNGLSIVEAQELDDEREAKARARLAGDVK